MKKILSMFLVLCMVVIMLPAQAMAAHDINVMVSDDAPAITTHPADAAVTVGDNTNFTVAATGIDLRYQWQLNDGSGFKNIEDGGVYSGTTTATLSITGASQEMGGYQYRAVVSTTGISIPSNPAKLTLIVRPVITAVSDDSGISASDGYTNDSTLNISGTSTPNAMVELFEDNIWIGTTSADGSGAWSFDYTGTTLAEGTYAFTASASSSGITVSTVSPFSVTIDRTPPSAPVILSGADGTTSDTTPTFTGTAEPNSVVSLYDTDGATVLGTANTDAGGNWSITSSVLSVESHTITAKAADLAGNVSIASNERTIHITAPTPILTPLPTPSIQIDYVSEALTGFVSDGQYSINGSASFTISYGEVFPIYSQWMGRSVSIVRKGNGTTTSDSSAQTLSIPVRPAAPTNSDYTVEHETTAGANDGKLKVTIADCEYRSLNHYSGFGWIFPRMNGRKTWSRTHTMCAKRR
ncbi:hypothetical protein CS063_04830 [Sporanaerobium hydrogeniformans]|uniref:Uncharacterized protein n=1 Tax=Sporanaerobium hydrogeniformans TaxID=3072179 RepID=A0AC61DFN5_9FIRM|nr:Ig-like domain-containing protein [Sporanaerobium hydrogeniformans]PHV71377.1 hypothetical protein CS063_04830 [Sporanaerobium hydrogeniformans]